MALSKPTGQTLVNPIDAALVHWPQTCAELSCWVGGKGTPGGTSLAGDWPTVTKKGSRSPNLRPGTDLPCKSGRLSQAVRRHTARRLGVAYRPPRASARRALPPRDDHPLRGATRSSPADAGCGHHLWQWRTPALVARARHRSSHSREGEPLPKTDLYGISQCTYKTEANQYTCPERKELTYVRINPRNRTHVYQSTRKRCRDCSQKPCCRQIAIHIHEPARQLARTAILVPPGPRDSVSLPRPLRAWFPEPPAARRTRA